MKDDWKDKFGVGLEELAKQLADAVVELHTPPKKKKKRKPKKKPPRKSGGKVQDFLAKLSQADPGDRPVFARRLGLEGGDFDGSWTRFPEVSSMRKAHEERRARKGTAEVTTGNATPKLVQVVGPQLLVLV